MSFHLQSYVSAQGYDKIRPFFDIMDGIRAEQSIHFVHLAFGQEECHLILFVLLLC